MKRIATALIVLSVILLATTGSATTPQSIEVTRNLTSMPLAFTANHGQWDERVLFRADAGGATMWFTADGVVYQFTRVIPGEEPLAGPVDPMYASGRGDMDREPQQHETMLIKAAFVGANPNIEVVAEGLMEYKCNYFIGNDPTKWHTDVPNYGAIVMHDIFPGVDLRFSGNTTGELNYQYLLAPGVDGSQIGIEYEVPEGLLVDEAGRIAAQSDWGEISGLLAAPVGGVSPLFDGASSQPTVSAGVGAGVSEQGDSWGMTLEYSTYLGGSHYDEGYGIAIDGSGCAYVTGLTGSSDGSSDFPTENAWDDSYNGGSCDAFVTKFSAAGNSLLYSTFLGGSGYADDWGFDIAVDEAGCAYVTGYTESSDFPTQNPYQTYQGDFDVFVTKLSSSGNSLVYSTYLGGSMEEGGKAITIDGSGNAYVTGYTYSSDFPTEGEFQTDQLNCDAFVTKLNSSGNALVYSTYLGGRSFDWGLGIAIDGSGNAYITGSTLSSEFPIQGEYQVFQGGYDAYVTKLNSSGNALVYSTYLGGSNFDNGYGIAVDGSGNAYITGWTLSSDFPTEGEFQTYHGYTDAFVTKLNSSGNGLIYSTYLGGGGSDHNFGIAVDGSGCAYVTGVTQSSDFPTENAWDDSYNGGLDVFVTKFSAAGNSLLYSTFLGGEYDDRGNGIAIDGSGCAYVTGRTTSSDFPTENAWDDSNNGGMDVFVTKLSYGCCIGIRGNVDSDGGDAIDISDLVFLVDYMFNSGPEPPCLDEADIDGSGGIDISDLVFLVDYMFSGGPPPVACP